MEVAFVARRRPPAGSRVSRGTAAVPVTCAPEGVAARCAGRSPESRVAGAAGSGAGVLAVRRVGLRRICRRESMPLEQHGRARAPPPPRLAPMSKAAAAPCAPPPSRAGVLEDAAAPAVGRQPCAATPGDGCVVENCCRKQQRRGRGRIRHGESALRAPPCVGERCCECWPCAVVATVVRPAAGRSHAGVAVAAIFEGRRDVVDASLDLPFLLLPILCSFRGLMLSVETKCVITCFRTERMRE